MDLPDTLEEQQKRDHALYFLEAGDVGFSPERNKRMVEESIRKTNAERARRNRLYKDQVGERVDAVITYLNSRIAEGNTPIEKYFGKKMLAHLRGQQILETLKTKIGGVERIVYIPK
jgi:hypothetical protein